MLLRQKFMATKVIAMNPVHESVYPKTGFVMYDYEPQGALVDLGPTPPENMVGRSTRDTRPHPWSERRAEQIKRWGDNIKKFVEPMGFVEAFDAEAPKSSAKDELAQLMASQCSTHPYEHEMTDICRTAEIAPEFQRLAANGVHAFSLNIVNGDDDEEAEDRATDDDDADDEDAWEAQAREHLAKALDNPEWNDAIAATLDARTENFLREHDRRLWYSSRPKVAYEVVDDKGRRGVTPKSGHPWSQKELMALIPRLQPAEDIRRAMEHRRDPKWRAARAMHGPKVHCTMEWLDGYQKSMPIRTWLDSLDPERTEFLAELDEERYREENPRLYPAGEKCPGCEDGTMVIYENKRAYIEKCSMCRGTMLVPGCLGFDGIPGMDPDDGYRESEPGNRREGVPSVRSGRTRLPR